MDDNEQQQDPAARSIVGPLLLAALVCLPMGFIGGRAFQQHQDDMANTILTDIVTTLKTMKTLNVPQDPFMLLWMKSNGGYTQRMELQNDVDGIAYLELHFIPRAALDVLGVGK